MESAQDWRVMKYMSTIDNITMIITADLLLFRWIWLLIFKLFVISQWSFKQSRKKPKTPHPYTSLTIHKCHCSVWTLVLHHVQYCKKIEKGHIFTLSKTEWAIKLVSSYDQCDFLSVRLIKPITVWAKETLVVEEGNLKLNIYLEPTCKIKLA